MARLLILLTLSTLAVVAVVSPALAGGGGGGSLCRGFSAGTDVDLLDSCLEGTGHHAAVGSTLTVHNRGHFPHTYTAVDGSFDTGTLQPGEQTEIELAEAGVWPVYCTLHASRDGEGMAGLLVVTDGQAMDMAASTVAGADAADRADGPGSETSGSGIWWAVVLSIVAASAGFALRGRVTSRSRAGDPEPG